jgi:23S rRNA pseudouridine2457 synthase
MSFRYFVVYKPYGILSQFSGEEETLKSLWDFPEDVYPVGRLDKDSEGLLLITNDKSLNHRLLDPKYHHERMYWVQVEGEVDKKALAGLENGVNIRVGGKDHLTQPAKATRLPGPLPVPERYPPIRFRKNVPDSWLALTLKEGKNRQVRKMTASVGFPTLRLIRWAIEGLNISGFASGEVREFDRETLYRLLNIRDASGAVDRHGGTKKRGKKNKKSV